jgi:hypothetical protein
MSETGMSVEVSADAPPPKSNELGSFQSTPGIICLVSTMAFAVFIACYCFKSGFRRKKSTSSLLFSPKKLKCDNIDANNRSEPGTVAYIGMGRDRMSVELCQTCIESNKMLRQLSSVIGSKEEVFEPCDLCK